MSLAKNFFLLLVGTTLLTACSEDAKFPELRAGSDASADKIVAEQSEPLVQEEMVEVDISQNLADVAVDEDGTVIIAAAHPMEEKTVEGEKPLKIKPILKEKSKKAQDVSLRKNPSKTSLKLYEEVDETVVETKSTSSVVLEEVAVSVAPEEEKAFTEPSVTYQLDTFYFPNGGSQIQPQDRKKIREIVKIAKEKKATIYVLGYSSSRTSDTDYVTHKMTNFKVSLARAEAVAEALVKSGLKSDRVLVEALSDSRPAYLEVMPEGERLNRRVEVYIGY
ncbi:MAG: OmpA family protein [Alphaproteobacteria bacterium]|nr:OmpA family protein [Alphaproteobacteria bacterium]